VRWVTMRMLSTGRMLEVVPRDERVSAPAGPSR